jgi:hypothetical protein
MIRRTSAAALFVLGVLALGGCKDKEPEPQAVPVPTGTAAAVTADPGPTGAAPTGDMPMGDAMDGGADASAAAVAPTSEPAGASDPATPKATGGGSIDACCKALAAARSTKNISVKTKIEAAYSVCGGIAKRVKAGETSRSAALTQIRSAMTGATVPGECR